MAFAVWSTDSDIGVPAVARGNGRTRNDAFVDPLAKQTHRSSDSLSNNALRSTWSVLYVHAAQLVKWASAAFTSESRPIPVALKTPPGVNSLIRSGPGCAPGTRGDPVIGSASAPVRWAALRMAPPD